jgi:hypothetical protein
MEGYKTGYFVFREIQLRRTGHNQTFERVVVIPTGNVRHKHDLAHIQFYNTVNFFDYTICSLETTTRAN